MIALRLIAEGFGRGFLLYLICVLICVYVINGARGFWPGFWQGFVILSVMNLIDRFLIDEYWVGHTKAWIIPGTEEKETSEHERKRPAHRPYETQGLYEECPKVRAEAFASLL